MTPAQRVIWALAIIATILVLVLVSTLLIYAIASVIHGLMTLVGVAAIGAASS